MKSITSRIHSCFSLRFGYLLQKRQQTVFPSLNQRQMAAFLGIKPSRLEWAGKEGIIQRDEEGFYPCATVTAQSLEYECGLHAIFEGRARADVFGQSGSSQEDRAGETTAAVGRLDCFVCALGALALAGLKIDDCELKRTEAKNVGKEPEKKEQPVTWGMQPVGVS